MRKLKNKTSIQQVQKIIKGILPKRISLIFNRYNDRAILHTALKSAPYCLATAPNAFVYQTAFLNNTAFDEPFPEINLDYIKELTTDFGIKQSPEPTESFYSLDDNAAALVAMCEHYELTKEESDIKYITIYFNFIKYCLQPKGYFFKYVDFEKNFTKENDTANLADSNGRAIWALGYMISKSGILPEILIEQAELTFQEALLNVKKIHSTIAIAFVMKGLYYRNIKIETVEGVWLIKQFANRLVQLYREVENENWKWFQSTLSLDNSVLSEALLCAWLITGEPIYKKIAKSSFDFLLSKKINVSDKNDETKIDCEPSIEMTQLIFALGNFYKVFKEEMYIDKMKQALKWLSKKNKLSQRLYNRFTGTCSDTLTEIEARLNLNAESTVNYIAARLQIKKYVERSANKSFTPDYLLQK